jgi:hypothetical protein
MKLPVLSLKIRIFVAAVLETIQPDDVLLR